MLLVWRQKSPIWTPWPGLPKPPYQVRLSLKGTLCRPPPPFGVPLPPPQHKRMPIQRGPRRTDPAGGSRVRRKDDSEKDLATARTVCRDGWGDRPMSGNGCLHPNPRKRPDEGRDTSMRWLEHRGPERTNIGEAGSVTETETGRRAGGGADRLDDSRLNFRSRLGPRPSTGGDVTILTPFSISPMTDASVDALPTLFLAYCAIDHADSDLAD